MELKRERWPESGKRTSECARKNWHTVFASSFVHLNPASPIFGDVAIKGVLTPSKVFYLGRWTWDGYHHVVAEGKGVLVVVAWRNFHFGAKCPSPHTLNLLCNPGQIRLEPSLKPPTFLGRETSDGGCIIGAAAKLLCVFTCFTTTNGSSGC
jgi:hypothetical protein